MLGFFPTHMSNCRWLGVDGSVTAKGFCINSSGTRLGISFSGTITGAGGTPTTPTDLYGEDLPEGTEAMLMQLSGDVYMDLAPAPATGPDDFEDNYANYPQVIAEPDFNIFGRSGD